MIKWHNILEKEPPENKVVLGVSYDKNLDEIEYSVGYHKDYAIDYWAEIEAPDEYRNYKVRGTNLIEEFWAMVKAHDEKFIKKS
jgi:hypothetical protein